eukprot:s5274_g7.t1
MLPVSLVNVSKNGPTPCPVPRFTPVSQAAQVVTAQIVVTRAVSPLDTVPVQNGTRHLYSFSIPKKGVSWTGKVCCSALRAARPSETDSESDSADYVDSRNDPYEGAYNRREPGGLQTIGGIPTGGLPVGVVIGIAVALLIFGFGVGFCIFYRRKKAITEIGGNDRVVTAAGTIIGSGAANPKKVEDDGVPATANHSPEEPHEGHRC